jgi:hypothetical protein
VKRYLWAALGVAGLLLAGFLYGRFGMAPGEEELERLRQERRILSERLRKRLAEKAPLPQAAEADVLVGIPAPLAERFVGEVVTSLFSDVKLTLRDLEVRKEGEVQGRILLGRRRLGSYALTVSLAEVKAVLRAGRPRLDFADDRVGVALPVTLTEGSGRGRLQLSWDGRGLAGTLCGDLELDDEVAGTVAPATYTLRGGFRLAADGAMLVARPEFADLKIDVRVEPSPATWELMDKAIQGRGAVCRGALRAADIRDKVKAAIGRGFTVTLPRRFVPVVRLPVELKVPLDLEGSGLRIHVRPSALAVTRARLWYGAEVEWTEPASGSGPVAP